uniref:Kelch like family member 3 n=1 Tax=Molossus molossus TaxID=27622 RepID=A0A7J8I7D9_MOLMO|nr:kelch like family member 3 [Molossus molossus]
MEWQSRPGSMPVSPAPPSAALSVPGKLYAVGGYDGASRQCLSTVEQYSPATNEWTYVADMSTRRSGAGVGVLSGQLYATGGHDGPLVRKSVEVYDPGTNTWKQVADMNMCRRNAEVEKQAVTMVDVVHFIPKAAIFYDPDWTVFWARRGWASAQACGFSGRKERACPEGNKPEAKENDYLQEE